MRGYMLPRLDNSFCPIQAATLPTIPLGFLPLLLHVPTAYASSLGSGLISGLNRGVCAR
jgi:hypothetical protein